MVPEKAPFFEMAAEDFRMPRFPQISEGQVWIRCTGSIKKGAADMVDLRPRSKIA